MSDSNQFSILENFSTSAKCKLKVQRLPKFMESRDMLIQTSRNVSKLAAAYICKNRIRRTIPTSSIFFLRIFFVPFTQQLIL